MKPPLQWFTVVLQLCLPTNKSNHIISVTLNHFSIAGAYEEKENVTAFSYIEAEKSSSSQSEIYFTG